MVIESIVELIQNNPLRSGLMSIPVAGIVGLGYVLYQDIKDIINGEYIPNEDSLEQAYKPKDLPSIVEY